jgi:hypothetical protein
VRVCVARLILIFAILSKTVVRAIVDIGKSLQMLGINLGIDAR